jgi:hypothetical protein
MNVACPFCGSRDVELVSAWGGQIITSQVRCRECSSYFEAIREQFEPPAGKGAATLPGTSEPTAARPEPTRTTAGP